MAKIEICEVGPRDGLQSEPRIWSANERIELINLLSETGVSRIEAVSFVHPKRVPQMAEAETVMADINRKEGVTYAGLALNTRGADRAIAASVDEVRYVVVASETPTCGRLVGKRSANSPRSRSARPWIALPSAACAASYSTCS